MNKPKINIMDIENTIAVELFKRSLQTLEKRILSSSFKYDVKYHSQTLNGSLSQSFGEIHTVLSKIVDKYYIGFYDVEGFIPFNLENLNEAVKHNLNLIKNAKKLLKFCNL